MEEWDTVDSDLKKLLTETDLDDVSGRRRIREAFKDVQFSIDHFLFKAQYPELRVEESYEVNSRGLEIFSKSWVPQNDHIKAILCFCHAFGDTCTFFFEGIARKLASSGYGVFAMDYPGFGLSEGLYGYIPNFDYIVDDVIEHFSKIKEKPEYSSLPRFLFSESMGGAVALKVHFKEPNAWDGAILLAPMCKIADEIAPPWILKQILYGVANFLPKAKLCPEKNLAEMACRAKKKQKQIFFNVLAYTQKLRLGTAVQLLDTAQEIQCRLKEVSLPLLILQGEADLVTDPSASKQLYEQASSTDKKLILYKDAYHALLEGEPDEVSFQVFDDIISWLDKYQTKISSNEPRYRRNTQIHNKGHYMSSVFMFTCVAMLSLVPYFFFQNFK